MAEPGQVDGHQVGVLGQPRPGGLEREQAFRPRTQQQRVIVAGLALRVADRQPVDGPKVRLDAVEPDAQGVTPSMLVAGTLADYLPDQCHSHRRRSYRPVDSATGWSCL